jgi:uncharacterized tellurite resistance protein B-like protein
MDPYHLGLLSLTHLLISADGEVDHSELNALQVIKQKENIPESTFQDFQEFIREKKDREIFEIGISAINKCKIEDRLRVLVMLYKLSEVDGRVHVKEIRLLLYSIKLAGVEFEDVANRAMNEPALL